MKKLFSIILAIALVASMAAVAFAASDTSTKSTTGYGTLTGTVWSTGSYSTGVTSNTDSAKLTITGLMQNSAGTNVSTQQIIYSTSGATSFSGSWSGLPSTTYAIYGTHGVQNGSTYSAYAVYTVTHV